MTYKKGDVVVLKGDYSWHREYPNTEFLGIITDIFHSDSDDAFAYDVKVMYPESLLHDYVLRHSWFYYAEYVSLANKEQAFKLLPELL